MNTLLFGILAGLAAAFFSSVSYLVSRHHGTREKQASRRMLIFAHVIMGVLSASAALSIYSLEIFIYDFSLSDGPLIIHYRTIPGACDFDDF